MAWLKRAISARKKLTTRKASPSVSGKTGNPLKPLILFSLSNNFLSTCMATKWLKRVDSKSSRHLIGKNKQSPSVRWKDGERKIYRRAQQTPHWFLLMHAVEKFWQWSVRVIILMNQLTA